MIDINTKIQLHEFDNRTRVALFNYTMFLFQRLSNQMMSTDFRNFVRQIYTDALGFMGTEAEKRIDRMYLVNDELGEIFMHNPYYEILDLLQFIVKRRIVQRYTPKLYEEFNSIFKHECVGYRFIANEIVNITNEDEIRAIEEVIASPYSVCATHISKAVTLLYNREKPDYENSIKESISAIEAMCRIIVGNGKATLSAALKSLTTKGVTIHPALKEGYEKIYGYAGDASGIRHAGGLDSPNATFEEAKYMLVSCSAFVNYLKSTFNN